MFKNPFVLSVLLSVFFITPVSAVQWCRLSNDTIKPCENNMIPISWAQCGSYNQEAVWCHPAIAESKTATPSIIDKSMEPSYRFYAGLSVGYAGSVDGGMNTEYADQPNSWLVPGSFQQSNFEIGRRSIPLQASAGVRVIDYLRVDISYTHQSGIKLPDWARTSTGRQVSYDYSSFYLNGGEITSDQIMLNAYYNFDRQLGRFMGGHFSPYFGMGVGWGINKISDYDIMGNGYYSLGTTDSIDIHAYHTGSTTNSFIYMFELGGSWEFFDWLVMDVFTRWTNLGNFETTGDVLLTKIPHNSGPSVQEESFTYNDKKESGKLNAWDIGLRLRFLF